MRKTRDHINKESVCIAVDIDGLAAILSCGETTARKIGEDAEARINIGRRVLYSVEKVQAYIKKIAC